MKATTLRTETLLHIHKAKVFCFLFLIRSELRKTVELLFSARSRQTFFSCTEQPVNQSRRPSAGRHAHYQVNRGRRRSVGKRHENAVTWPGRPAPPEQEGTTEDRATSERRRVPFISSSVQPNRAVDGSLYLG